MTSSFPCISMWCTCFISVQLSVFCRILLRLLECSKRVLATTARPAPTHNKLATRIKMPMHGTISEFDPSVEDWSTYVERVNLYLAANDIVDADKKRAVLLSVCGAKTYRTIRDLLAPDKPTDLGFSDIVKKVQEHYNPPPVVTVQRFKFNSRSRQPGESVAKFVAALRHLAIYCEYGDRKSVV